MKLPTRSIERVGTRRRWGTYSVLEQTSRFARFYRDLRRLIRREYDDSYCCGREINPLLLAPLVRRSWPLGLEFA